MVYLFLTFVVLLEVLLLLGLFVQRLTAVHAHLRDTDRVSLSLWLGFFFCTNAFLLIAVVAPLTFGVGILVLAVFIMLAVFDPEVRLDWKHLHARGSMSKFWLLMLLFIFVISLLGLGKSDCGDTGNYHFQAVKWLSEHGLVPGLAHIQHRFGFQSSWYVIPALLNHGPLENRVQGIAGGIGYLLFLGMIVSTALAFLEGKAHRGDHVIAAAALVVWPFRLFETVSIAPNLGVILGIPLVLWLAAMTADRENKQAETVESRCYLFLLSAAGLASIKITALFMLLGALIWFPIHVSLKNLLNPKSRIIILLLHIFTPFIAGTILSGYPFYPSTLVAFPTEWRVPSEAVSAVIRIVHEYWSCGHYRTCNASSGVQLSTWLINNEVVVWLILLSLACYAFIIPKRDQKSFHRFFALIQLVSCTFILTNGPGATLVIAWLFIIPLISFRVHDVRLFFITMAASHLLSRLFLTRFYWLTFSFYAIIVAIIFFKKSTNFLIGVRRLSSTGLAVFSLISLLVSFNLDVRMIREPLSPSNVLRPELIFPLEKCEYSIQHASNFDFFLAHRTAGTQCQCWQHELPCTLESPTDKVRLLPPACGLGCGFGATSN